MESSIFKKAGEFLTKKSKHRYWQIAVASLGIVVIVATAYVLSQPAQTLTGDTFCGMEEHLHTDECYQQVLTCGFAENPEADAEIHVHDENCYAEEKVLICAQEETAGHVHTDECLAKKEELVCGQEESEGHIHTDDCLAETRELTCGQEESEEHSHTDECYSVVKTDEIICGKEETEGHVHTEGCYSQTLAEEVICGLEETEGHVHGDECYEIKKNLICDQEETAEAEQEHVHTEACYELVLTCGLGEHTHVEECYKNTFCGIEVHSHTDECLDGEGNVVCGKKEHHHSESCYVEMETYCGIEWHIHGLACYDKEGNLICGAEEHVHVRNCYLDPNMTAEDLEYVEYVNQQVANMFGKENSEITEGSKGYFAAVAYSSYEGLKPELRKYIINSDEMLRESQQWIDSVNTAGENGTYTVNAINRLGAVNQVALVYGDGNQTVKEILKGRPNADFYYWTGYVVQKQEETYTITEILPNEGRERSKADVVAPADGFILFFNGTAAESAAAWAEEGDKVELTFAYGGIAGAAESGYGTLSITKEEETVVQTRETYCGQEEHEHTWECYVDIELKEEELAYIGYVNQLVDGLPAGDEINRKLEELKEDEEAYKLYYREMAFQAGLAYTNYEGLRPELRKYVLHAEELLALSWLWKDGIIELASANSYRVYAINQFGSANEVVLVYGDGIRTVEEILGGFENSHFYHWTGYAVEKQGEDYVITAVLPNEEWELSKADAVPAAGGFILFFHGTSEAEALGQTTVGQKVAIDFSYEGESGISVDGYGMVVIGDTEEEHIHTEACYDENGELICGYPETEHEHTEACYNENGELICGYPETEHEHTEECYDENGNLICGYDREPEAIVQGQWADCDKEVHNHEAECYDENGTLVCGKEEHNHTEECYEAVYCGERNHTHTDLCRDESGAVICGREEHIHGFECYIGLEVSEEDRERILETDRTIEGLPSYEEIGEKLEAFDAAWDDEGYEKYFCEVMFWAKEAYAQWEALGEELQKYVVGSEKLMELSWIWEASTMDLYQAKAKSPKNYSVPVAASAETKDLVEINLYDYGTNINRLYYHNNQKYPAFQQDDGVQGGISITSQWGTSYNFGDNIAADIKAEGGRSITNQGGAINATVRGASSALSGRAIMVGDVEVTSTNPMSNTLGADGYPRLSDGTSLSYLFNEKAAVDGVTYATHKNRENLDGLFQYDSTTGAYEYDSRKNHAEFDEQQNKIILYDALLTANYIMYPFGNFFPFNKISTETTLVNNGNINRQYFLDIAASAQEKANSNADQLQSEYSNLASRLKAFVSQMDSKYGTSWDGRQVLNAYFEAVKPREGTIGTKNDVWIDQIFNGSKSLYSLDYDEVKNFFFGMSIEMNYVQPKGGMTGVENRYPMKFEFAGDDDVWVYIDGIMFLNLSGIHRHVAGTIDFMEGKVYYYAFDSYAEGVIGATTKKDKGEPEATVTFEEILTETLGAEEAHKLLKYENGRYTTFKDYSAHNFKFYYMERGAGSSVCRINFNFPVIPKNSLAVSKTLDTENIPNNALGNPDFSFQVLKALENGTKTEELFITEGAEYKVYRNGQDTGERRRTGKDGVFALKAGEMAVFTEISADEGKYYVRERLESRVSDQYETDIEVGGTTKVEDENGTEIGETDFIGIDSPVQNIDDGALTLFNFTNKITGRLGTLEITKRIREEGSDYADLNQDFKFEIKLDKEPLKAGIEYTVTDEAGAERKASVEEGGIVSLKAGETVKIENILAGTEYTVQETAASSKGYLVTYDAADDQVTVETADGISYVKGKIKANTEGNTPVQITVTNSTGGTAIEIPGIKKLSNNDGKEHRYQFELEQVKDGTGTSFEPKVSAGTAVVTFNEGSGAESDGSTTDSSDKNSSFAFHLNYSAKEVEEGESVFYYKVSEVETEDTAAVTTKYDGREYLVEVKVTKKSENGSIVMEAKIVGYYLLTRTESGTITQTPVNSVEFENELVTDLTIAKDANGKVEKDKEFTFEVKIETGAEALLNGEFTAHRKGGEDSETEEFTVTFQNGLTEVKLKPGQVLTIKDLPYGAKWTVEEKDAEEYEVSYMINSKAEKLSAESRLSEKYVELPEGFRKGSKAEGNLTKDTNVITFINQIAYEKLTIAKYADDLVSEETEFLFRVVVKVEDMNGLFVPYTGDCIVTKSGEESPQTATFTEGQIEVSLKKNQSLTIDKLPHGATWSISEEGTGYYVYHIVDSSKVMDSLSEALEVIRDGSVETKGAFAEGDFKDENNQQEQVYVTFVNQVSFELPETGGHGTILYTLAGIGLTLTGCLLYRKKFRERRV